MIICITGLPGSGKTTLAQLLYDKLKLKGYSVSHFTSDQVRQHLFQQDLYIEGQTDRDFTDDELMRSYNGLFMLIEKIQQTNPDQIIITDGTFRDAASRVLLNVIANQIGADFKLIKISAPQKALKNRLSKRHQETGQETEFNGTYEEPRSPHLEIYNDSLRKLDQQANTLLQQWGLHEFLL